jgi:hypothetical protein
MTQVSHGSGTGGAAIGRRSRIPLLALTLALAFALLAPPAAAQVSDGGTEPGVDPATPVGGSGPDTSSEPAALEPPTATPEPSATEPASSPDTQAPTLEPTPVPPQETAPQPPQETALQPPAPSPETTEGVQALTEPSAPSSGPQPTAASEPPPAETPAPRSETAPASPVLELPGPAADAPAEALPEPVARSAPRAERAAEAMLPKLLTLMDDLAGVRTAMTMFSAKDRSPAADGSPSRQASGPAPDDPSPVPSPDPAPLTGSGASGAAGGVSSGGGSAALYALLIAIAAVALGLWGRLQLVPVRWRSVTIVALNERPG